MVAAFYDVLTTEQLEVFAVLSADHLGYGSDLFRPTSWFYGMEWSDREGTVDVYDLHALLVSACLLAVAQ